MTQDEEILLKEKVVHAHSDISVPGTAILFVNYTGNPWVDTESFCLKVTG